MGEISHLIEDRLSTVISLKTGIQIDAIRLPEIVDAEIKKEILAL